MYAFVTEGVMYKKRLCINACRPCRPCCCHDIVIQGDDSLKAQLLSADREERARLQAQVHNQPFEAPRRNANTRRRGVVLVSRVA